MGTTSHISQPLPPPTYRLDELLAETTCGAKVLDLHGHVLLGLGVKGGILNQTVDKNPDMVFDVHWFQIHTTLVLSLGNIQQLGHHLVHHVGHMIATPASTRQMYRLIQPIAPAKT